MKLIVFDIEARMKTNVQPINYIGLIKLFVCIKQDLSIYYAETIKNTITIPDIWYSVPIIYQTIVIVAPAKF